VDKQKYGFFRHKRVPQSPYVRCLVPCLLLFTISTSDSVSALSKVCPTPVSRSKNLKSIRKAKLKCRFCYGSFLTVKTNRLGCINILACHSHIRGGARRVFARPGSGWRIAIPGISNASTPQGGISAPRYIYVGNF